MAKVPAMDPMTAPAIVPAETLLPFAPEPMAAEPVGDVDEDVLVGSVAFGARAMTVSALMKKVSD